MAPRLVNVDEQAADGATLYTIGGLHWLAPEPSMDLVREIVMLDVQAMAVASAELQRIREQVVAQHEKAVRGEAPDEVPDDLQQQVGEQTIASMDSLSPQLEKLLALADADGNLLRGQWHPPNGEGLPVGGNIEVLGPAGENERFGLPVQWAPAHLSAKWAARILGEVLGEGPGQV